MRLTGIGPNSPIDANGLCGFHSQTKNVGFRSWKWDASTSKFVTNWVVLYNSGNNQMSYGSFAMHDFSGDGVLDLITGGGVLYDNDGTGNFAFASMLDTPFSVNSLGLANAIDIYHVRKIVVGDVDADGHVDILYARDGENWLFMNNGDGLNYTRLHVSRYSSPESFAITASMVDLDGDGGMEIFVGNRQPNGAQVSLCCSTCLYSCRAPACRCLAWCHLCAYVPLVNLVLGRVRRT